MPDTTAAPSGIEATAAYFGDSQAAGTPSAATQPASPAPAASGLDAAASYFSDAPARQPAAPDAAPAKPSGIDAAADYFADSRPAGDDIDHVFRHGVLAQESGGQQFDKSGRVTTSIKGALGAAQVMPDTAPEAARLAGLPFDETRLRTDRDYNVALGSAYLRQQYQDFGNLPMALAAYNAGPRRMRTALDQAARAGTPDQWMKYLPAETRDYIPKVMQRASAQRQAVDQGVGEGESADNIFASKPASESRTWGQVLSDTGLGVASGLAGLVKTGGELGGLVSGNMNNVVTRVSDAVQNYLQDQQSDQLKGRRAARDADVAAQDGVLHKAWTSFADTVSDPALALDVFASNAATMVPGAVVGRAAAAYSGGRAMLAAMEAGPVSLAARQAIAKSAAEVGVWSGTGASAAQQGADVAQQAYDDAMAKPQAVWDANPEYQQLRKQIGDDAAKRQIAVRSARETFTPAAAISLFANGVIGGNVVERALVGGAAREGEHALAGGMARRVATGMAQETAGEAVEEGGGQFSANVSNQKNVDPNQDLGYNVGENAGQGAAGGFVQGAAASPFHHGGHQTPVVDPTLKPAEDQVANSPDASPLSRAALAGNTHPLAQKGAADQAALAAQNAPADPAQRLAELEAIGRGTPAADGQPAQPGRIFTPEEQKEYAQLKALKNATPGQSEDPKAAAAAAQDQKTQALSQRASQIEQSLRADGTMDVFRSEGSEIKPAKVVADMALAKSPSANPAAREQAITRLEYALEYAGKKAAQPRAGETYDTTPATQGRNEQGFSTETEAAQQAGQSPVRPPVDRVIAALKVAGPMRSAEQSAIVTQAHARYTPAQMALIQQAATYAAGLSAEQRIQLQELQGRTGEANVPAAPRQAAAPAQESGEKPVAPAAREQVAAPVVSQKRADLRDNASSVPSVHRKRRATLRQLVEMGMNKVERRGADFVLTDGKREFALEGPGDAQLARREIQDHFDAKTGVAQGHAATNAQVEADNYKKGEHVAIEPGVTFIAEHGKGTERVDRKHTPPRWRQVMKHAYGDLAGTVGADGDKVDAFLVGDGNRYFVIDQVDPATGKFDEHKVMLRSRDEASARAAYLANYEPGWKGLGAITEMTASELRSWLADKAATKRAVGKINGSTRSAAAPGAQGSAEGRSDQHAGGVDDRSAGAGGNDGWARDRVARLFGGRRLPHGLVVAEGDRLFVNAGGKKIEILDRPDVGVDVKGSAQRGETAGKVTAPAVAAIETMAEAMGQKPVWFRSDDFGDGFTLSKLLPDVLFLNERMTNGLNPMVVFGHEFFHNLKQELPEAHLAIVKVVRSKLKGDAATKFREDYGSHLADGKDLNEAELDEIVSDLGGNLLSDPTFWNEVMAEINKANPEQASGIIARLAAKLMHLVEAALEAIKGGKFKTDALVSDLASDLEAVRGEFRKAMAQYMKANGIRQAAMQAQILKARTERRRAAQKKAAEPAATEPTGSAEPTKSTERDTLSDDGRDRRDHGAPGSPGSERTDGQDLGTSVGGESAPQGWAGATRIRGKEGPRIVYRGAKQPLQRSDFDLKSLGRASGNTSSGLGVWFTTGKSEARDYARDGGKVQAMYLDIRHPKVIKAEDMPVFEDTEDAHRWREKWRAQGYDGLIIDARHLGKPEVHMVAFDPRQAIYADDKQADVTRSTERARVHDMEMSTRIPSAKGKNASAEDPLKDLLISDFAAGKDQERWLQAVHDLVTQYPNYREAESAKTVEQKLERMIRQMADNLEWLHNEVPAEIRARSKHWYDGARVLAEKMAASYGLTDAQAAGIMAVLSPQKDWFMNVSLADRVASIVAHDGRRAWTPEMDATADRIFGKAQYQDDVAAIRGKRFSQLDDDYLQAMWLRTYDEAHNSRSFEIVSPEGEPLSIATAKTGSPAKVAWGGLNTIAKAISIFRDGSASNISEMLGGKHKVRNFYNNILAPNSKNGHVTIDTHAVAAALLRPLSGNSIEVMHNFGGAKNAKMGLEGTYALYEEAYRRAAERLGLLPRELQSITWEAIRGMYRPGFKSQATNVEQIDKIWNQFKKGRLSYDAVRELARELAGGIDEPSWFGRNPGTYAEDESAADEGDVAGDELSGRRAKPAAGGARAAGSRAAAQAGDAAAGAQARGLPDAGGVRRSPGRVAVEGGQDQGAGSGREEDGSLKGLPRDFTVGGEKIRASVWAPATEVAQRYMDRAGLAYAPPADYVKVDPERARRIAEAYEAMPHAPNDPLVQAAYKAMIDETLAQYRAALDAGLKVEFIDFERQGDPYAASPRLMTEDVRQNNHMWVFSTRDGFGSGEFDATANPMLAQTGFVISGKKALVNDIFRAVHDYFGHVKEGVGFRADGEENAWRAHSAMYTPLARRALTTETRAQNSWVNFGPHGDTNRSAVAAETHFADQKTGLLPGWVTRDGSGVSASAEQHPVARSTQRNVASELDDRIDTMRRLLACLGK